MRLFKTLGIQPKHTLRCVLFTAEENSLAGGREYARVAKERGEKHLLAVETDGGGFAPKGFELGHTSLPAHERAARWRPLLEPYGLFLFEKGTGGADVSPLMMQGVTVADLLPQSQWYFDYHHAPNDTIDKVHPRELQLGAAALASLIWLVDTEGL
jgi:Zn-dependent M28 family amino/carboxypeptidase